MSSETTRRPHVDPPEIQEGAIFWCSGCACPGLPYPASERAHPSSCHAVSVHAATKVLRDFLQTSNSSPTLILDGILRAEKDLVEGQWYWLRPNNEGGAWVPAMRQTSSVGGWSNLDTREDFEGSVSVAKGHVYGPIPCPSDKGEADTLPYSQDPGFQAVEEMKRVWRNLDAGNIDMVHLDRIQELARLISATIGRDQAAVDDNAEGLVR